MKKRALVALFYYVDFHAATQTSIQLLFSSIIQLSTTKSRKKMQSQHKK
jgi:hypothetical protein